MQVQYQYVPPQVASVPVQKLKSLASFTICIKRNGVPVPVPAFEHKDDDVDFFCGTSDSGVIMPQCKINIRIGQWGTYCSSQKASQRLMEIKDKLPDLFRKVAARVPSTPMVDLMTGKSIDQTISVEYCFQDEVYETTYKETKQSAWVYFMCPLASPNIKAISKTDLVLHFGHPYSYGGKGWSFPNLGWLEVPEAWTEAQLEAAFRDLAKNLLQKGTPTVQTWTAKLGTTVTLE